MRTWLLIFFWLLIALSALARPSQLREAVWGASNFDEPRRVLALADGGLLLAGNARPWTNGNVSGIGHGGSDFWLLRLDAQGNRKWDIAYGGSDYDDLWSATALRDGGFLLVGSSASTNSGTKTGGHIAELDGWIVRVDAQGGVLWDRTFGGLESETLFDGIELADGGFLVVGSSYSPPGGTKQSDWYGFDDGWVIRLDAAGNQVWDKSFGGDSQDSFMAVRQTDDGGCVLLGSTDSQRGGTKVETGYGMRDVWVVRLDTAGAQLWEKNLGSNNEDYGRDLLLLPDGGLLVVAASLSREGGTKTSPNFSAPGGVLAADGWLNRLDVAGRLLWDRSYGGTGVDMFQSALRVPGGFLIAGYSYSQPGGTKTSPAYSTNGATGDGWVVRIDDDGRPIWDQSFGSPAQEEARGMALLTNGNYFVAGRAMPGIGGTRTLSGFGSWDVYAVELEGDLPRLHVPPQTGDEIATNGFRFTLHGLPGQWYRVDRSDDLVEWETLDTRQATMEPAGWVDPAEAGNGYYRPTLVPAP